MIGRIPGDAQTAVSALRFSCVIPVYNGQRFLGEALDSALAQSHPPYEIIVIDDGSTDATPAVAARYGDRITYHRQKNAGPAAARNCGFRVANGELVAILDADDLWHPEKLARQAARFAARPELAISLTHMRNFWVPELAHEERQLREFLASPLSIQSLVVRRELFASVGLFDTDARHKDVVSWLIRACRQGAIMEVLPDVLVYRRIHQLNLSRRRSGEDTGELLALAKLLVDRRRQVASDKP